MQGSPEDELFTQIAGRAGSIDKLLNQFFGFLHRRTDLYIKIDSPDGKAKMGFPEGVAEQMVLKAMRQFPYTNLSDVEKAQNGAKIPKSVHDSLVKKGQAKSESASSGISIPNPPTTAPATKGKSEPPSIPKPASSSSKPVSERHALQESAARTDDGKLIPIGNGGFTDKYYWTQDLEELSVHIDVPHDVRTKEIDLELHSARMILKVKGELVLEGTFDGTVNTEDSFWTLAEYEGNGTDRTVDLLLTKRKQTWWKSVLQGDDEIDCTKVDSTRRIGDYDASTQGTIRKLMHDQKQRRLGLPTSEEEQMNDILEKAKLAPGSPFL